MRRAAHRLTQAASALPPGPSRRHRAARQLPARQTGARPGAESAGRTQAPLLARSPAKWWRSIARRVPRSRPLTLAVQHRAGPEWYARAHSPIPHRGAARPACASLARLGGSRHTWSRLTTDASHMMTSVLAEHSMAANAEQRSFECRKTMRTDLASCRILHLGHKSDFLRRLLWTGCGSGLAAMYVSRCRGS
jgi:hypothetical protein